jgi:hypothetical protein
MISTTPSTPRRRPTLLNEVDTQSREVNVATRRVASVEQEVKDPQFDAGL